VNPYLLLALGFVLIFLEFFLPGAILGITGSVFVVISIFLFASQTTSGLWVLVYIIAIIIALAYLIRLALWKIRHSKSKYSIYLDSDQEGYVASSFDTSAIGKTGIVLSDLKPGGYILIDGVQHQALSQSGYITKGSEIEVISGQEESLIVKRIKKELSS
jgi:membrane-bound serine protease (ClpP class)